MGFPGGISGKEPGCQCERHKRCGLDPWVRKRAWQPTLVFLPGESHRQSSLVGLSPWGHKELDMTEVTQHTHITADDSILFYIYSVVHGTKGRMTADKAEMIK